ncbi:restriction endonuclease subunit S [Phocaeicola plebeius]|uniref:restriction endonuclease subunit S n=1 Tax=Phocaeicola plebeius TaxID=310297 RepID=UPI00215EE049|nr:restriction endonuclease subunit S [Phocaeicola plebeius]MCR8882617.1 restriction endonuclease subunit S [Phocaeicola plebeius]MDM8286297.1 restriction endonuclease subunit S [Phocaeicola plebeius]
MSKENYRRLGDYIREVDVRNRDLEVKELVGLTINKAFIPSVANTIGTDLSNYKVIRKEQFACSLMQVSRDGKMPVAMFEGECAIMSPAYPMFEVVDKNILLPQYLMMWFSRNEFDREASFYAVGGVRGSLTWQDFCDMTLPIPPIEQQRKIVTEYEAVSRRIRLNEQMIARLEETAQTLYRKMFVDGIDKENLPEGWRMGTIEEFCEDIMSGGTPSRMHSEYWNSKDYRWLKTGEVQNNIVLDTEEYISEAGLKNSSAKIIPSGAITMAMYGGGTVSNVAYLNCETATNQACCNMICKNKTDAAYLYFHLRYYQNEIKRLANGGAQENLSQEVISQQPIYILDDNKYNSLFVYILNLMIIKTKGNNELINLQSLLLARMGQ